MTVSAASQILEPGLKELREASGKVLDEVKKAGNSLTTLVSTARKDLQEDVARSLKDLQVATKKDHSIVLARLEDVNNRIGTLEKTWSEQLDKRLKAAVEEMKSFMEIKMSTIPREEPPVQPSQFPIQSPFYSPTTYQGHHIYPRSVGPRTQYPPGYLHRGYDPRHQFAYPFDVSPAMTPTVEPEILYPRKRFAEEYEQTPQESEGEYGEMYEEPKTSPVVLKRAKVSVVPAEKPSKPKGQPQEKPAAKAKPAPVVKASEKPASKAKPLEQAKPVGPKKPAPKQPAPKEPKKLAKNLAEKPRKGEPVKSAFTPEEVNELIAKALAERARAEQADDDGDDDNNNDDDQGMLDSDEELDDAE